jgi:hypothetical protein
MDDIYEQEPRTALAQRNLSSETAIFWCMVATVVCVVLVMIGSVVD